VSVAFVILVAVVVSVEVVCVTMTYRNVLVPLETCSGEYCRTELGRPLEFNPRILGRPVKSKTSRDRPNTPIIGFE